MIITIYRSFRVTMSLSKTRLVKVSREAKGRYSVVIGGMREGMLVEVDEVSIQGVEVNTNSDIVVVDAKVVEVIGNRMVVKV